MGISIPMHTSTVVHFMYCYDFRRHTIIVTQREPNTTEYVL